jgi:hypothetical protein
MLALRGGEAFQSCYRQALWRRRLTASHAFLDHSSLRKMQ